MASGRTARPERGTREPRGAELMRCDRHVHSWYSARAEVPELEPVGRECYSDPLEGALGKAA
jgi:hypothetical protein